MKHSEHITGGKHGLVFFFAALSLSFPLQHYYFREPVQWLSHSQVQGSHGEVRNVVFLHGSSVEIANCDFIHWEEQLSRKNPE